MEPPLIATKLYLPRPHADAIPRPRLVARLNELPGCRLALLSAPAGFGKTTLLSQWLRQQSIPAGWVTLDEDDDSPAALSRYLAAGWQSALPGVGETALAMLAATPPAPVEDALIALLNELAGRRQAAILVLDDYHAIRSPAAQAALAFMLRHLPPEACLVLSSRTRPSLSLARLRGQGQALQLDENDLRFTLEEAAQLLRRAARQDFGEDEVAALVQRCEGWVAALQMTAAGLRAQPAAAGLAECAAAGDRQVMDYLLEEVFQRQTEDVQQFLLQTALLKRLSGPLCDALTGRSDGQAVLEALEGANLFLAPLDAERRWYRYHALFARLLQARLRRRGAWDVPALYRRAATWCQAQGLYAEALEYALLAGDPEWAAQLLEEHEDELQVKVDRVVVARWLQQLPEHVLRARPALCILAAAVFSAAGEITAAGGWLDVAEKAPVLPAGVRGKICALRAYIAHYGGDERTALDQSHCALEHLPEADFLWRGGVATLMGDLLTLRGDLGAAYQAYAAATGPVQRSGNLFVVLNNDLKLVQNLRLRGRLRQALEGGQAALARAGAGGYGQASIAGGFHALLGEIYCEWRQPEAALEHARRAVELSEPGAYVVLQAVSLLSLCKVRTARGELLQASQVMERLEKLAAGPALPPWMAAQAAAWKARLWMAQAGDDPAQLEGIRSWLQEQRDRARDWGPAGLIEYDLALARLLVAQGRLAQASGRLQDALGQVEAAGWVDRQIEVLALQAVVHAQAGDRAAALGCLERAFDPAIPQEYIQTFLWPGEPMAQLLRQATAARVAPQWCGRLLAAFPSTAAPVQGVEPLSERELEVLRLMAAGASNQEIARRLFISLPTVKYHNTNIFGKLGVSNRVQAINRARAMGLLSAA
ncbi:MAG: hypothetical protein GYA17_16730 [Chloroflexi bacterium]|nr:hypothetical protein [Chloroflexota bacterium]